MTAPTLKLEIAFTNDPYGVLTWTDVTADLAGDVGATPLTAGRGKNYYLDAVQAGQMSVRLRNTTGQYTPSNASGPHYGFVLPWRPIRATATLSGTTYGIWRGFVKSWTQLWVGEQPWVDLACVDIIQKFASYTSLPATYDELLVADYGFTGSTALGYYTFDEAASPYKSHPDSGHNLTGTATQVTGLTGPLAAQFTPSSGVGATSFGFAQGGDLWFELVALPTSPGITNGCFSLLENYGNGSHTYSPLQSQYYAEYANDVNVGLYVYLPPTNYMPSDDSASFETSTGGWSANNANTNIARVTTWWARGTASLIIKSASTTATIEAVSPFADFGSNVGGQTVTVRVAASGGITLNVDFYDAGGVFISSAAGSADAVGSISGAGVGGTVRGITYSGTAPTNTRKVKVRASSSGFVSGSGFEIDMIAVYCGQGVTTSTRYFPPSDATVVHLQWHVNSYVVDVTGLSAATKYHLAWDAHSGTPGVWLDGVAQAVTNQITSLNPGTADQIQIGKSVWGGGLTTGAYARAILDSVFLAQSAPWPTAALALAHYSYGLAKHESPATTTDVRVADLLDIYGWPSADRVIESGGADVLATGSLSKQELMPYLQAAVDAELGNFFIDQDGNTAFHTRGHRNTASVVATFGEDIAGGEVPYQGDIQIVTDDLYLFNDVVVNQDGTGYSKERQDAVGQVTYGVRTMQPRTVILANATDIDAQATTLLAWYETPRDRVATITIEGRSRDTNFSTMLAREIGDLVTVKRRSIGGPTVSLDVFIDGVQHVIGPSSWRTTFQLTPKYPATTY